MLPVIVSADGMSHGAMLTPLVYISPGLSEPASVPFG